MKIDRNSPASSQVQLRGKAPKSSGKNDRIDRLLRETYREVLQEPIPRRLLDLLYRPESKEKDS